MGGVGGGGRWGWWTVGAGIPGKTLLLLAAVLLGDTRAAEDHLTRFMQTYWCSRTNQLPWGTLFTIKWKMNYNHYSYGMADVHMLLQHWHLHQVSSILDCSWVVEHYSRDPLEYNNMTKNMIKCWRSLQLGADRLKDIACIPYISAVQRAEWYRYGYNKILFQADPLFYYFFSWLLIGSSPGFGCFTS